MKESSKTDADDEIPNIQQFDTGLENKTEEINKPLEIQSTKPEN